MLIPDFVRTLPRREGWADLAPARIIPVSGGMSAAAVYRVTEAGRPERYLKTARGAAANALRDEIARTRWLAARGLRVPEILRVDDRDGDVVLLMTPVAGVAADAPLLPAPQLVEALARALKTLHALPAAGCPFDESLGVRLARATETIAAGEVDPEHFDERNRGIAPDALLARLTLERPHEDIVVVHGDATLSNLMVDGDGNVGFIDCGNAGRADRYTDLAVLAAEIEAVHGPEAAARFVRSYGAQPWNDAKARYFLDLYELF